MCTFESLEALVNCFCKCYCTMLVGWCIPVFHEICLEAFYSITPYLQFQEGLKGCKIKRLIGIVTLVRDMNFEIDQNVRKTWFAKG